MKITINNKQFQLGRPSFIDKPKKINITIGHEHLLTILQLGNDNASDGLRIACRIAISCLEPSFYEVNHPKIPMSNRYIISSYLDGATVAAASKIGRGNVSEGLRIACVVAQEQINTGVIP